MISFDSVVLMSCAAESVLHPPLAQDQRFIELFENDAERISQTDRGYGRRGDLARIRRRFQHGFRYFAIEEGGGLISWFWAVHAKHRYLDEIRWMVPLDETQVWLRDTFVAPTHRGRRLSATVVGVAGQSFGRPVQLLTDVESSNHASLQSRIRMGFQKIAVVRSLSIGQRLLLRTSPPDCIPCPEAIRPRHRVLWLSHEELEWHRAHIA
jgi:hypothetical protein